MKISMIPEWEIEKAIIWNPEIIEIPDRLERLQFIERQKRLKNNGKCIDLLFKSGEKYVIVEIKAMKVEQKSVIEDQILEYKLGLSEEMGIPYERILCVLVALGGFSEEVRNLCDELGIIAKELNENDIVNSTPKLINNSKLSFFPTEEKDRYFRILQRRGVALNFDLLSKLKDNYYGVPDEIRSVETWVKEGVHDELAKKKIAKLFMEISKSAPIRAHEVELNSDGKLTDNEDMWFWLFYSVMDRRANAATFVKAKETLENHNLFRPQQIMKMVKEKGERATISRIKRILEDSGFPLLNDTRWGKASFPKSIVDAAKLISRYDYDFEKFYRYHYAKNNGNLKLTYNSIWNALKDIYGAGPRIRAQFIRGMVLKGPWRLPLTDNKLLEKCEYNVRFAGPTRFALIKSKFTYFEDLGRFADEYLDGNRAIISHVLWYIRKKYCDKQIKCDECPMAGYCRYFLKLESLSS